MNTSVFLAWLIGPLWVVVGIAILLNRDYYRDMVERFFNDPQDYFLSGFAAFIIGIAMIQVHNHWVADWTVIITVTGWLALIKGLMRLLFPQWGRHIFLDFMRTHSYLVLWGVIMIPFGAWLTWNAWLLS